MFLCNHQQAGMYLTQLNLLFLWLSIFQLDLETVWTPLCPVFPVILILGSSPSEKLPTATFLGVRADF